MRKKVLWVANDADDTSLMESFFSKVGHQLCVTSDGQSALNMIAKEPFSMVIAEADLRQMRGVDLLRRIKTSNSDIPFILVSANACVKDAVEAMKSGADDFMLKPLSFEMIKTLTNQKVMKKTGINNGNGRYEIISNSAEMKRLLDEAEDIANSRASIFIQGESGTGKELFARHIHNISDRKDGPFIAINCAALPETLLESEMFGHEKGAFTGAAGQKKGKFELANHGTLLLDEISEMDYSLQSKLLRVLQEKEVVRLGGAQTVHLDVRVISTTNREIEKEIEEGRFREDLFYRLNVIPFLLPPLKERRSDISLLAEHFIHKYNRIEEKNVKGLTDDALQSLLQMPWKGNIRELENRIERAILICKGELIDNKDLGMELTSTRASTSNNPFIHAGSLKEMEQKAIYHTLDHTNGNRTHAAEILGISVRTLRNKLNEYRENMKAN